MSSDTLRESLDRYPFIPLTLRLPSGKEHIIKKADLYMFSDTGRIIWLTEGDRIFAVDVATVEEVATTPAPDHA